MLFAEKVRYSETTHYDYAGFTVPMTLSLYNYYSSNDIISIYNWAPNEPQWWITGFDAYEYLPDPNKMAYIASIDFSDNEDMYNSVEKTKAIQYYGDLEKRHMIFDDDNMIVWIQWFV
ncbi:MAG: hypothetical protein K6C68_14130 [Ruminococcus sp.]|nr:hypothetical protein [Ruminococcus sp.]